MKFTDFQKKLNEVTEQPLSEAEEWVLGFDFEVEYTSAEGRDIQKHLEKKFRKNYSGSGSGGSGFDVSFDGSERELKKIKKYVEKEFGPVLNSKYTNFYQYEGYEVTEMPAVNEATKWKMGDGRPRGGARIENVRFWDLSKDELEYIIKDAGEAMRANPKARKATTGPGNWADQVNDASTVLAWRKKNGIKESVQIDEDEKTQRFFKGVHAELKKVMDSKYYREFRASNDGRALDNVINHFGKSRGMRVDKTVKSIIDKYGKNRDEYVKKSFEMAANNRLREEVEQIDEKYLLASEDLAAVRKQAKQLANKFPKMRFYVIHNKKHVGFGERYEIVTNVNFHMYRNMPIQGQYDGKGFVNESVELEEKNEPTNPALWKKAIAKAKAKFDVYPSAYANAWASKWYKGEGGGWKKVEESLEEAMSGDKLLGIFNKLKNKDTVEIKFDSGIRKGKEYQKFVVTSGKRTVGKARVERIIMKSVDNLRGVAYTLYNRKGNVTLAVGDMGVSIVDIKESVELDEVMSDREMERFTKAHTALHTKYHKQALEIIKFIDSVAKHKDKWTDSFGDYVTAKLPKQLKLSSPNTVEYQQGRGRGDWSFLIQNGKVRYNNANMPWKPKSGELAFDKFMQMLDIWKKETLRESVELDEAWNADSVTKNAEIGSKKGYGINIKKTGGVTKTPYKHMLMTTRSHGNVRVTFDHGKEEFEGTPQSVALHINKLLGIKESVDNPEYDEELGKKNIGEGKAWDAITKVKDKNQNQKVHGMIVDAMTANLLHKVHDALNSTNQKKFVATIDKNAAGLKKMVDFAYKQVK